MNAVQPEVFKQDCLTSHRVPNTAPILAHWLSRKQWDKSTSKAGNSETKSIKIQIIRDNYQTSIIRSINIQCWSRSKCLQPIVNHFAFFASFIKIKSKAELRFLAEYSTADQAICGFQTKRTAGPFARRHRNEFIDPSFRISSG